MKRTLFFCILAIMAIALPASLSAGGKKAKATFSEYRYDFGNVKEKGGLVSHEFVFTNTGDGNLLIVDATATCGCTRPNSPSPPGRRER